MQDLLDDTVQNHMTRDAKAVTPVVTVGELLHLFAADQRDAYPVISNEKLVGIVSPTDALKAFASDDVSRDNVVRTAIAEIMTCHVMTVEASATLRHAVRLMEAYHFKSLPVIDEDDCVQGIIAREDIVCALTQCERPSELPLNAAGAGHCAIA